MSESELTAHFEEFLTRYYRDDIGDLAQHYPKERRSLYIEYRDLDAFDPALADDWERDPETCREHAERALTNIDLPADITWERDGFEPHVRLRDTNDIITPLGVDDIGSDHISDYVAVRGQLAKVTGVGHHIREAAWECQRCGMMTYIPQSRSKLDDPHDCHGCDRQGPFALNIAESDIVDQRKLKLEQLPDEQAHGRGQSLTVYVDDDLCRYGSENGLPDRAGERVTVFGTYQLNRGDLSGRNAGPEAGGWLDGHALAFESEDYGDIDVDAHREAFEAVAAREDCIEQLAASIAPEIKADDDLATFLEACVAWLFNSYRADPDGGGQFRGDLHMGIISDPGLGKSTILSNLADIAVKCEFRSGTGLSAVGLTAAAVQEEFAGQTEWTLQPGVLPRANGGHCIIDEVDDVVDKQTKKMHDALEGDQLVKVDKAGISADLPTRTALLASGNPAEGRFDDHTTAVSQIDLDPALISRLDLLFAMRDIPDPDRDADIAEHILDSYDELSRATLADTGQSDTTDAPDAGVTDPPVDRDVFRAMVVHARETVFPRLTEPAKRKLKEYYVEVRTLNDDTADAPVPATARTLEAGIRLATAYARAELSETVDPEHAERAIRISRQVVGLNFDPETGQFDAGMTDKGVPKSQKERRERLLDIIADLETSDDAPTTEEVLDTATSESIGRNTAESELEKLRTQGRVYNPATDLWRVAE